AVKVRLLWLVALALLAGWPTLAQQKRADGSASIHGTITTKKDAAAASVGGITVKLTGEPLGGGTVTAETDDAGVYDFKGLKPGIYTLAVAQGGFKAVTRSVSLAPGQALVQDLALELETVAEKVEVHDQSEAIATESISTPNQEVSEHELEALPTT